MECSMFMTYERIKFIQHSPFSHTCEQHPNICFRIFYSGQIEFKFIMNFSKYELRSFQYSTAFAHFHFIFLNSIYIAYLFMAFRFQLVGVWLSSQARNTSIEFQIFQILHINESMKYINTQPAVIALSSWWLWLLFLSCSSFLLFKCLMSSHWDVIAFIHWICKMRMRRFLDDRFSVTAYWTSNPSVESLNLCINRKIINRWC